MPNTLIKSALGLTFGFLLINPASAIPLLPPTTVTGLFTSDDQQQQFEFSIPTAALVTIESISYAGGTFASNSLITAPAGGFDPIVSLFDSTGAFIDDDDDDDDGFGSTATDPVTGNAFDAFLQTPLAAGTYTVVVTQFDNFFDGIVGDDISNGFEREGDPTLTSFFGCTDGIFCDFDENNRSFILNDPGNPLDGERVSFFAVNVTTQAVAVPEPTTLALLGFGLVGAGLAYRRRRSD